MIPKFRAWDVHNMEMFANDQLIIWDSNVYANDPGKISVDKMRGWSIDEKYLMQSTGLFDVNGKEIFEGDIVKTERLALRASGLTCAKNIGTVKNLEGAWVVDTGNTAVSLWTEIEENEIIGNIYENPELVEEINE